jgi:hypothetical protein
LSSSARASGQLLGSGFVFMGCQPLGIRDTGDLLHPFRADRRVE